MLLEEIFISPLLLHAEGSAGVDLNAGVRACIHMYIKVCREADK